MLILNPKCSESTVWPRENTSANHTVSVGRHVLPLGARKCVTGRRVSVYQGLSKKVREPAICQLVGVGAKRSEIQSSRKT